MKSLKSINRIQKHSTMLILFIMLIGLTLSPLIIAHFQNKVAFNWKGIRKEIKDSIQVVEHRNITNANIISPNYELITRSWIMKNSTEYELLQLINYPNGNVKAIAYEGLLTKKTFANRLELVIKAINDTVYQVNFQLGSEGYKIEIGKYLMLEVLRFDDEFPLPPPLPYYGFNQSDKEILLNEFRKRPKSKRELNRKEDLTINEQSQSSFKIRIRGDFTSITHPQRPLRETIEGERIQLAHPQLLSKKNLRSFYLGYSHYPF